MRLFFLRQQKNCLENSNRRRENLTAGDASAICIFILAAQDFKLKTQTSPHYLFPYAKRKWKILHKGKKRQAAGTALHCLAVPKV